MGTGYNRKNFAIQSVWRLAGGFNRDINQRLFSFKSGNSMVPSVSPQSRPAVRMFIDPVSLTATPQSPIQKPVKAPAEMFHATLDQYEANQQRLLLRFVQGLHAAQRAKESNIPDRVGTMILKMFKIDPEQTAAGNIYFQPVKADLQRAVENYAKAVDTKDPDEKKSLIAKSIYFANSAVSSDPFFKLQLPSTAVQTAASAAVARGTATIDQLTLHVVKRSTRLAKFMLLDAEKHRIALQGGIRSDPIQRDHFEHMVRVFSDQGMPGLRKMFPGTANVPPVTPDAPKLKSPRSSRPRLPHQPGA